MKTITGGGFQFANGTAVASGTLRLILSQDAVGSTGQVVPKSNVDIVLDASGNVPAATNVWANDELTPASTFYIATVLAANTGNVVYGPELWVLAGVSPISLTSLIPATASPILQSPSVLLNPTAVQTISGFQLNVPSLGLPGGSVVGGSLGSLTLTAAGTNQNITLTPSGTGFMKTSGGISLSVNPPFDAGSIELPGTSWLTFGGFRVFSSDTSNVSIRIPANGAKLSILNSGLAEKLKITEGGSFVPNLNLMTFSATPVFDASSGNTQEITLTGNVTSFTILSPASGESIKFIWHQDATGGRTVTGAPTNLLGFTAPGTTAGRSTIQSCTFNGVNWYCETANLNI